MSQFAPVQYMQKHPKNSMGIVIGILIIVIICMAIAWALLYQRNEDDPDAVKDGGKCDKTTKCVKGSSCVDGKCTPDEDEEDVSEEEDVPEEEADVPAATKPATTKPTNLIGLTSTTNPSAAKYKSCPTVLSGASCEWKDYETWAKDGTCFSKYRDAPRCGEGEAKAQCTQFGTWVQDGSAYLCKQSTSTGGGSGGGSSTPPAETITAPSGRCGPEFGNEVCAAGKCCSRYGYCGVTSDHCCSGNKAAFNGSSASTSSCAGAGADAVLSNAGEVCGAATNKKCSGDLCCSGNGICGTGDEFCTYSENSAWNGASALPKKELNEACVSNANCKSNICVKQDTPGAINRCAAPWNSSEITSCNLSEQCSIEQADNGVICNVNKSGIRYKCLKQNTNTCTRVNKPRHNDWMGTNPHPASTFGCWSN